MEKQQQRRSQLVMPRGFMGRVSFLLMHWMHRPIYDNAAPALALQPADDLLDVGCGDGYFLDKYAAGVRSIAGLDHSELAISSALGRHKNRIAAGTAKFVRGEAARIPWPDGAFSVVTSMGSFVVFPEPLETLIEMHRVLRPGGRALILLEINAEDGKDHSTEASKYGMRIWSEAEIREALTEAGFSEVRVYYAKGPGGSRTMMVHGRKI